MVRPSTGGERIVIVDFVSGIVSKSPSCLDAKRVLYPVNDIKVFYEHKERYKLLQSPQNCKKMKKVTKQVIDVSSTRERSLRVHLFFDYI